MDIATQAEVFLREAGYDTWAWSGASPAVTCFESPSLVGFLHVFDTAATLLDTWEDAQQRVLARHAAALRTAGAKAWNVYSIFLTTERASPEEQRAVERLEEDFALTRKIARSEVQTAEELAQVLLPLAPIQAQPLLANAGVADRLRARTKDIPETAITAFLGTSSPEEVAAILGEQP